MIKPMLLNDAEISLVTNLFPILLLNIKQFLRTAIS